MLSTLGDIMIHVRAIMSTLGDTMSTSGDIMSTFGDIMSTSGFSIEIEKILSCCSPTWIMISLRCTKHPWCTHYILPMYSWYLSDVLNIPNVLMVSLHIHHDIPPMYWTSINVLMISLNVLNTHQCTEHPPMYWTHILQGENSFRKVINTRLSLHSKANVLSYQNRLLIWTAAEACMGHGMMSDSIPYAMFKSAIPSLIFTY